MRFLVPLLLLLSFSAWPAPPNDAGPVLFPVADGFGNAIGSNGASLNVNTKTPISANAPASVSVNTSSTSVLSSNSARKGLVIINVSSSIVSFGIGASAVLNAGITLLPGGTWNMDENSFTTASITAIASAASSALSVQEFQ